MIDPGAPSTGSRGCTYPGVRAPPGVVMVAPPEVLRNAWRAKSEAALLDIGTVARPGGIIEAGIGSENVHRTKTCACARETSPSASYGRPQKSAHLDVGTLRRVPEFREIAAPRP